MNTGTWPHFPEFLERFMARVELAVDGSGCWLWQGACDPKGYGNTRVPHGFPGAGPSRFMKAHRASVTLFRGIVLGPLQGHHLHRTDGYECAKECVNPDHIDGRTHRDHYLDHHPEADYPEPTGLAEFIF